MFPVLECVEVGGGGVEMNEGIGILYWASK